MKNNIITHNVLIMLVLTTFIFSCQTNKGSYSNLPQIDIDMAHLESISFKELFNETALIPLATADSTLLGICYPSYTDSCYFMRDNSQQELFVFKTNGEFKFKISNQGRAPGQYNYLTEISYNPFSKEIILLEFPNKIHIYNANGRFIENLKIDSCMNIENILPISADTLLIIDGHNFSDYYIYAYRSNQIIKKIEDSSYHLNTKKFYVYNNNLYHFKWYSNIIYKVHNNNIEPHYRLNFSQFDFQQIDGNQELFQQMYKNRHDDSKLANLISQKFPYIIKDIQENDNYIFITLQQTGKNFEHLNIIYDKTKCKTYEFKPKNESVVWNNWNDYLSQQYYTTFISAIEKEYINYKHLNEGNKIIYNKVGENDNPIIIKYKLQ